MTISEIKPIKNNWESALDSMDILNQFKNNRIGVFALSLRFGIEDVEDLAFNSIVDGSNDKKIDLFYINEEENLAVIIQAYFSENNNKEAKSNKATDLNATLSWLFSMTEENILKEKLKKGLEHKIFSLRKSIKNKEIKKLYFWYVHNCQESENVQSELSAFQKTLNATLKSAFPSIELNTTVQEIGQKILTELYESIQSPIIVNDQIEFECEGGFEIKSEKWSAYSTKIKAFELYKIYKKYQKKIFSANIRDYLGSMKSESNINSKIIDSVKNTPENFWVFNNGITILTNQYEIKNNKLTIEGLTIVNGAQTTGAIGSLDEEPSEKAEVPVRFISAKNNIKLISDITYFNNSQNQIIASDFRSNDPVQRRLIDEFKSIKRSKGEKIEYKGGRRGGIENIIKRNPSLIHPLRIGQLLTAFHEDPLFAYKNKSKIWEDNDRYSKIFNEKTTAQHLLFVYSLNQCIQEEKEKLINLRSKSEKELTTVKEKALDVLSQTNLIFIYIYAISEALEGILDTRIDNKFDLIFKSNATLNSAKNHWQPIIEVTNDFLYPFNKLITKEKEINLNNIKDVTMEFKSVLHSIHYAHKTTFSSFASKIKS